MENNKIVQSVNAAARSKFIIGDRVFVVLPCENFGYGRLCQVVEGAVKLVCLNQNGAVWYKVYCEFRAEGFSKLLNVQANAMFFTCREALGYAERFVND